MLRVGQLRFAWSPPEWVVATSLCQSTGRYPLPHGILNAGVWFRRARLLIVSPDSSGTACPLSGRNSTYPPVQISGASSLSPNKSGIRLNGPRIYNPVINDAHRCLLLCAKHTPKRIIGTHRA